MTQNIHYTNCAGAAIDGIVGRMTPSSIFVITDSNTATFVLPKLVEQSQSIRTATQIGIPAGDASKNADTLQRVWHALSAARASRHALIINVGGGVVTDLGGFAAATYKRGISCINVPTTVLGAVDAAVGGKTGINFDGYKNQVGAFYPASDVIVSSVFFDTLPVSEKLSGYAEMFKHGLLDSDEAVRRLMIFDITAPDHNAAELLDLLHRSVTVKENIVKQDPTEKGIRKALNLGHTIGHAFEEMALHRHDPIPHGYAVAWGLVAECILSSMLQGFDSKLLHTFAEYIRDIYGVFTITCDDYSALIELMRQDKKNLNADAINFTLLRAPGDIVTDVTIDPETIESALDIYRDLMSI